MLIKVYFLMNKKTVTLQVRPMMVTHGHVYNTFMFVLKTLGVSFPLFIWEGKTLPIKMLHIFFQR